MAGIVRLERWPVRCQECGGDRFAAEFERVNEDEHGGDASVVIGMGLRFTYFQCGHVGVLAFRGAAGQVGKRRAGRDARSLRTRTARRQPMARR